MREGDQSSAKGVELGFSALKAKKKSYLSLKRAFVPRNNDSISLSSILTGRLKLEDAVKKVMATPLKQFMKENLSYRELKVALASFIVLLIVQLKYSPRARKALKTLAHNILFTGTVAGFIGAVATLAIKYKLEKES